MALDEDKIELIEQIQAEILKQRGRLINTFIPENVAAKPFPAQIAFFKDTSLSKLLRAGNRAAKTFTNMRDLAWKIMRTHPYRQDYNVFGIHDKKWREKACTTELEIRYLKTKPELLWCVGPTFEFVKGVMWERYLEKMIPAWYISEIKWTNQKNIESVIFKNGDVLKCKTYAQQEETQMGYVVNGVYVDEMPREVKTITELIVRTFDCDGSISLGFTPLVENDEIRKYLDGACASGTMMLHSWTVFDNPHYKENPDRLKRVLAEYENMPENERLSRLHGDWFLVQPNKTVFEGIEPEVVEDFQIPLSWRQVRFTDPASHITGHCIFAEDPETAQWYCTTAVEITWGHIARAADILDAIEKYRPYPSFKYWLSKYDNAEAWFGAESKNAGYLPCMLKNREAAIMQTRNMVAPGKLKFFRRGAELVVKQFRNYHYGKDGKGVVKKDDHVLDCIMYFCREVPEPLTPPSQQNSVQREAILGVIAKTEQPRKVVQLPYKQRFGTYRPLPQRGFR